MSIKKVLFAVMSASITAQAFAQAPIDVAYEVTGSSFNWTMDFKVTNNLTPGTSDMVLYFFAVQMPTRDIVGSPTGWDPDYMLEYGQNEFTNYSFNNIWFNFPDSQVTPGVSISGFKVHSNQEHLPATIAWNAFAYSPSGGSYDGNGPYQHTPMNPLFEGVVAGPSAVPEPGEMLLATSGLAAMGLMLYRRQTSPAQA